MSQALFLASVARVLPRVARARISRGPARSTWSFGFELFVTAMHETARAIGKRSWPEQRLAYEALVNHRAPPLRKVAREAVDAGGVPSEWFSPRPPHPSDEVTILYLHGGAYVFGSSNTHGELIARIALACHGRVLAANYRLAPEHPFPAALDDAVASWRWLLASGVDPRRAVVAGDSAGGGLATALLLRLRDAGDPMPAAAALICPWVDLAAEGGSFESNAAFDWGDKATFELWIEAVLGGRDPRDPLVSPVYADLSRLPPMLVQSGEAEVIADQARQLVVRAKEQGTDARLAVEPDMVHNWHSFAGVFPQCGRAIDDIAAFVRENIG